MTVLVTGAAGAIGAACVERFLLDGEDVLAQDLDASIWVGVPRVTALSGDLLTVQCRAEVARESQVGLDAVVCAHGIAGSATLADCSPPFVERVLAVNATTIPVIFDTVRPYLAAKAGCFVVVASQASLTGEAGNTAYCAAKFAVLGWVRGMATAQKDLTVHVLCPGATQSPLLMAAQKRFAAAEGLSEAEYFKLRARQIAVGRYGEPFEIAAAASYLAGPGSKPTVLAVTGGDVLY